MSSGLLHHSYCIYNKSYNSIYKYPYPYYAVCCQMSGCMCCFLVYLVNSLESSPVEVIVVLLRPAPPPPAPAAADTAAAAATTGGGGGGGGDSAA